ncbi:hypothetical protein BD289DRAFT_418139 [Coniella lustricola]|uniref:Uncharacterized protein n=1 Tax=Coniella lustricola TaxID=2025994 RepID=A0A2T2ZU80_9PEZI|nr:hypothetical protein BD289DRAFT_418139 [Coniella lustricola]
MVLSSDITFRQEIESTTEFNILATLIHDNETTVKDAVQQMCDLILTPKTTDRIGGDWYVSLSVLELAQRNDPSQHVKLVEFMYQLHKITGIHPETGRAIVIGTDTMWTDLPSFGPTMLEDWLEYGGAYEDVWDSNMTPEHKRRWVNLNAFLAQLTQAADFQYHSKQPGGPAVHVVRCPLDESSVMIRTMKHAVEDGFTVAPGQAPKIAATETAAAMAACEWFIHASDRLWTHVQHQMIWKDPENGSVQAGIAYASRGWIGFELDRWETWESWLADLEKACVCGEHEHPRNKIHDALIQMRRVKEGRPSAKGAHLNTDTSQALICLQHRLESFHRR